jgi:hypothetical protein
VGDDERLQRFVDLLKTPDGCSCLLKDRAAIAAQEVNFDLDPDQIWQQFLEQNYRSKNDGKAVTLKRIRSADDWSKFVQSVQTSVSEIQEIAQTFKQTAANLEGSSELTEVMKQLLNHEAAPAFVYHAELQKHVFHPGLSRNRRTIPKCFGSRPERSISDSSRP